MFRSRAFTSVLLLFILIALALGVGVAAASAPAAGPAGGGASVQPSSGGLVVYLHGSARERGEAYGSAAAAAIRANVAQFRADVAAAGYRFADLRAQALGSAASLPERMRAELRAMAAASGVAYGDVLAMNRFTSTVDGSTPLTAADDPRDQLACTQFVAAGSATVDGRTIASKNRDASKVQVLVISAPTKAAFGFVGVASAGEWGVSFGLSTKGVCVGNNWMPTPTTYPDGLGELSINRRVLETCASVDAAIRFVDDVPKHHGTTVMVADKSSAAFIEAATTGATPDVVARKVTNGVLVHTNHYMYEPFYSWVVEDGYGYFWTPSVARYDRAMMLLAEHDGALSADDIRRFNRDLYDWGNGQPQVVHAAHPEIPDDCWGEGWPGFSICNARTVSSGVFVLDGRYPGTLSAMWTAIGSPSYGAYTPVHNAAVAQPTLAGDGFAAYMDGTACRLSTFIRDGELYEWGELVPLFEAWEDGAQGASASTEAAARELLKKKQTAAATALLTESDVDLARAALELLKDLR